MGDSVMEDAETRTTGGVDEEDPEEDEEEGEVRAKSSPVGIRDDVKG